MTDFQHQHSAHCETGVMSSLLKHNGLDISEAMALGISSSMAFAFLPFIKLNALPLVAYRMPPGSVIKGLKKCLKLDLSFVRFSNPGKGMDELDRQLNAGNIVGMQTSVFWLPYFPDEMRFHFNAHNLIVFGKTGDNYLISDPVFETPMMCSAQDLQKARFAKGSLAPKGAMYYLNRRPESANLKKIIRSSIKKNARSLTPPIPLIGIKGMHFLARKIARLPKMLPDTKQQLLFLSHIVRMQEEIGTGGAGFRFIYASFLQEAATLTGNNILTEASKMMTDVGDEWRNFALHTVKMCKNRSDLNLRLLSELMHKCANDELEVWKLLKKI